MYKIVSNLYGWIYIFVVLQRQPNILQKNPDCHVLYYLGYDSPFASYIGTEKFPSI